MRKVKTIFKLSTFLFLFQAVFIFQAIANDTIKTKNYEDKINRLNDLSTKLRYVDKSKALLSAQKALELSISGNYLKGKAISTNNIGIILRDQGNYDFALKKFEKSLKFFTELNISRGVADVFDNIGGTYYYQGNLSEALDFYFKALRIREELHDGNAMAGSYINLGMIYKEQENYEKALQYLFKGLNIVKENKNDSYQAIANNVIGLCYKNTGHLEKAMDYYLRSLQLKKKLGDKNGIALSYNNLGRLYEELGNFNKALAYHFNSLKIKNETNNQRGIAFSNASIGTCYYKKNDIEKAIPYLEKAYNTGVELGVDYIVKKSSEVLNHIYFKKGNYQLAYQYLTKFKQSSDSLINIENAKKTTRMAMEYDFGQRQRQQKIDALRTELKHKAHLDQQIFIRNVAIVIAVFLLIIAWLIFRNYKGLKKANTKLKEQKAHILYQRDQIQKQKNKYQKLNFTKDKFFSIVAHDLRNPFHTLIGFSELILSNYDTYGDEEKLKYLKIINDSSKSTHQLLENLLNWARTQTGNMNYYPEKVLVSEIVNDNIRFLKLNAEKKNIEIKSLIKEDSLVFIDKNMISTVLRNLMSNALKFTDAKGKILVYTKNHREFTEIFVEDTGIGISSESVGKLFKLDEYHSTSGTFDEPGTGLGLIICKEFVEKNGGNIRVESEEGKGSKFIFSVQKASMSQIA